MSHVAYFLSNQVGARGNILRSCDAPRNIFQGTRGQNRFQSILWQCCMGQNVVALQHIFSWDNHGTRCEFSPGAWDGTCCIACAWKCCTVSPFRYVNVSTSTQSSNTLPQSLYDSNNRDNIFTSRERESIQQLKSIIVPVHLQLTQIGIRCLTVTQVLKMNSKEPKNFVNIQPKVLRGAEDLVMS